MTSHSGQQIITIRILPTTSRSKRKQAMQCGQFIECNRNIVLKKLFTACGGEATNIFIIFWDILMF